MTRAVLHPSLGGDVSRVSRMPYIWLKQELDGWSAHLAECRATCSLEGMPGFRSPCGHCMPARELDGHAEGNLHYLGRLQRVNVLAEAFGRHQPSLCRLCGSKRSGCPSARCGLGPMRRSLSSWWQVCSTATQLPNLLDTPCLGRPWTCMHEACSEATTYTTQQSRQYTVHMAVLRSNRDETYVVSGRPMPVPPTSIASMSDVLLILHDKHCILRRPRVVFWYC